GGTTRRGGGTPLRRGRRRGGGGVGGRAPGAQEGPEEGRAPPRAARRPRRDLFYAGVREHAAGVFSGRPPAGAFYAFLRIDPDWDGGVRENASLSWRMVEYLIRNGRIGCVPGVDFGAGGEGDVRFCFARDRHELNGGLASMGDLFSSRQSLVASRPVSR